MRYTRNELNQKYGLDNHTWARKHDLLLEHLSLFMDIQEIKEANGRYTYEIEGELPDTIPPVPRKGKKEKQERMKAYEDFVRSQFSDFMPHFSSQAKVARDALNNFGRQVYGHNNAKSVAALYIKPAFAKLLEEVPNSDCWVWYKTYEPLDDNALQRWLDILKEEHITEKQQAAAFRASFAGIDISEAYSYYAKAIQRFHAEFNDYTIKVSQYLLKT